MSWRCPECKNSNSDESDVCGCGFKPDRFSCTSCNGTVAANDSKCPHCGITFGDSGHINSDADKAYQIRQVLKEYDKFTDLTCLECGYKGHMGIKKEKSPWYLSWWILVPVLLTGIGTVPAVLLGLFKAFKTQYIVECPSCRNILITKDTL